MNMNLGAQITNMARQRSRSSGVGDGMVMWYILAGIGVTAGFLVAKLVTPMVLGVTFTGLFLMAANWLGAFGGIIGSVTGFFAERVINFTAFVLEPFFSWNPWAIVGFGSFLFFFSILVAQLFTDAAVWR